MKNGSDGTISRIYRKDNIESHNILTDQNPAVRVLG